LTGTIPSGIIVRMENRAHLLDCALTLFSARGYDAVGVQEIVEAAAAVRCAADQGLFWQMHDWLFANQIGENVGSFAPDRLRAIAQAAGLDMAAYDTCMASSNYAADVRSETNQAVDSGVHVTPTLLINGTLYTGNMSVKDIGDAIVAAAGGATPAPAAASTPAPPTP